MKNKRAFERLVQQGIEPKRAIYYIRSVRDLGYSPETITKQMSAQKIIEIVDSVDRALTKFFAKKDA